MTPEEQASADEIIREAYAKYRAKRTPPDPTNIARAASGEVVNATAPRPVAEQSPLARTLSAPEFIGAGISKMLGATPPPEAPQPGQLMDQAGRFAYSGVVGGIGDTASLGAVARAAKIAVDNTISEPEKQRSYEEAVFDKTKVAERDQYFETIETAIRAKNPGLTEEEIAERRSEFFGMDETAYNRLSEFMTPEMKFMRDWRMQVHKQAGYQGTPDAFTYTDQAKEVVASSLVALPIGPGKLISSMVNSAIKNTAARTAAKVAANTLEAVTPVTIPATKTAVAVNMGVQLAGNDVIAGLTGQASLSGNQEELWQQIAEQASQQQISKLGPGDQEAIMDEATEAGAILGIVAGAKAMKNVFKGTAKTAANAVPSGVPVATPPPTPKTTAAAINPMNSTTDISQMTEKQIGLFNIDENAGLAATVKNMTGDTKLAERAYDVSFNFRSVAGREKDKYAAESGVLPNGRKLSSNATELRRMHNLVDPESRKQLHITIDAIQELDNRKLMLEERKNLFNEQVTKVLQKVPASKIVKGHPQYDELYKLKQDYEAAKANPVVDWAVRGTDADLNKIVTKGMANPRIKEFINKTKGLMEEVLEALHDEGTIPEDTYKKLKSQPYTIKTWGDPRGDLSRIAALGKAFDDAVRSTLPHSGAKKQPGTEGLWKRTLIKEDRDRVVNTLPPLERITGSIMTASSIIRTNKIKREVMEGILNHPTAKKHVKKIGMYKGLELDRDKHVVYHNPKTKKVETYEVPSDFARMLNYEPEAMSRLMAIPAFVTRWSQRFTTGAFRDIAGIVTGNFGMVGTKKNIMDATWTALALGPKGIDITPADLLKGMPIAQANGMRLLKNSVLASFRNTMLEYSPFYQIVASMPGGVARFDKTIEKLIDNNMQQYLKVADELYNITREMGTTPTALLGNTYDPAVAKAVMRTHLEGISGQQGVVRGAVEGVGQLLESLSSYSNYGLLMDQVPKLKKKYGSWDNVPEFEKSKLARISAEIQGGSMIRPGNDKFRMAAAGIPYANPTIQGTRILGKRLYEGHNDPVMIAKFLGYGVAPKLLGLAALSYTVGGTYNWYMQQSEYNRMRFIPLPASGRIWEHIAAVVQAEATGQSLPQLQYDPKDFVMVPAPLDIAPLLDGTLEFFRMTGAIGPDVPDGFDPEAGRVLMNMAKQYIPYSAPGLYTAVADIFTDESVSDEIRDMTRMGNSNLEDGLASAFMVLGATVMESKKTMEANINEGASFLDVIAAGYDEAGEQLQGRSVLWDGAGRVTRSNPLIDGVFRNEDVGAKARAVVSMLNPENAGKNDPRVLAQSNPQLLMLANGLADFVNTAMNKKGDYKRTSEEITNTRRIIDRINGQYGRAKYDAQARDKGTQNANASLHKLYFYKSTMQEGLIKFLQSKAGKQYEAATGEPLTWQTLDALFTKVLSNEP